MLNEQTIHQHQQLVMPATTSSNGSVSNGGVSNGENGMIYPYVFAMWRLKKYMELLLLRPTQFNANFNLIRHLNERQFKSYE